MNGKNSVFRINDEKFRMRLIVSLAFLVLTCGGFFISASVASAATITLYPSGVGNFDDWDLGAGATKVLAVGSSDATDVSYIATTTDGKAQTFTMPGAGLPTGSVINSITLNVISRVSPGSFGINLRLEKGTTSPDISDDSIHTLTGSYVTYSRVLAINPFTGLAWTLAEVNSWTTNFGVQYTPCVGPGDMIYITQVSVDIDYTPDTAGPIGGSISYTDGYLTTTTIPITFNTGSDVDSDLDLTTGVIERSEATLTDDVCSAFGSFAFLASSTSGSYEDLGVSGKCYQYQYLIADNAGNYSTTTGTSTVMVDVDAPIVGAIALTPSTSTIGGIYIGHFTTITADVSDIGGSGINPAVCFYSIDGGGSSWPIVSTAYNSSTGQCIFSDIDTLLATNINVGVSDTAGNSKVSSSWITVSVDLTAPDISIVGATTTYLTATTTYIDLGAIAFDGLDGDVTGSIVATGTVSSTLTGTYQIIYTATDYLGNVATTTRTVIVGPADPSSVKFTAVTPVEAGPTSFDNFSAEVFDEFGNHVDDGTSLTVSTTLGTITADSATVGGIINGTLYYSATGTADLAIGTLIISGDSSILFQDTVAPIIVLTGSDPQSITRTHDYSELGATASDVVDGDLTSQINIDASAVTTSTAGLYYVIYSVIDSSGNTASTTRTVLVSDVSPVITLNGSSTIDLYEKNIFTDPGFNTTDDVDGDLSSSTVVTGTVDTDTPATYTITYTVTDSGGNHTTTTRTVNVLADNIAPTVGPVNIDKSYTTSSGTYILGYSTSTVAVGDIESGLDTSSCEYTLDNGANWLPAIYLSGTCYIVTSTVAATDINFRINDLAGNTGTSTAISITLDIVAPTTTAAAVNSSSSLYVFDTWSNKDITVTLNATDTGSGIKNIYYSIDGGSLNIYTIPFDITTEGTTTIDFYSIDNLDQIEATSTIVVKIDKTAPIITLNGDDPQTIEAKTAYSELGATVTDNYSVGLLPTITTSSVDVNIVGSYGVTYDATDDAGNVSQVTRVINIVDTTKPVITLNGNQSLQINVGDTYTDAGASASDNIDGDITSKIIVDNQVNTSIAGDYVINYYVTDTANNLATSTRNVKVNNIGGSAPSGGSSGGSGTQTITIGMDVAANLGIISTNGLNLLVYLNSTGNFTAVDGSQHHFMVKDIDMLNGTVTIELASTPVTLKMNIGDSRPADLNGDGVNDVMVTYNGLKANQVDLTIKSLNSVDSQIGGQVLGVKIYGNGILLRTPSGKIYITVNNGKKYIENLAELKKYKGKKMIQVDNELSDYPDALPYADGVLLRATDNKIYFITAGKKQHIENLTELKKYKGKKLYNVSSDVIGKYSDLSI
ncbi:MAG: DUF5011 domain-containing protein [bacterium]